MKNSFIYIDRKLGGGLIVFEFMIWVSIDTNFLARL